MSFAVTYTPLQETLSSRGHIYKGCYEGWYSVSDEEFLTEEEVQDCVSPAGEYSKVRIKVHVEGGRERELERESE